MSAVLAYFTCMVRLSRIRYTQTNIATSSSWMSILLVISVLISTVHSQESIVKQSFSVPEEQRSGTLVGRLVSRANYTYELSTETNYFSVDSTTGDIKIRRPIDREDLSDNNVKFIVKAKSKYQQSVFYLIEVTVAIIDLNDNSPVFTSSALNYTVLENDLPFQPFTLTANDPDEGINGSSSLKYSIKSGNSQGYWNLTTTSQQGPKHASLALIRKVNRENINSFRLIVEAEDGGDPPRSGLVTVNVNIRDENDNDPKFSSSLYQASIYEDHYTNSQSNVVLQTSASDADIGFNSALVYSISTSTKLFAIDPLNGQIQLTSSLLKGGYKVDSNICKSSYCNSSLCLAVCILEIQVKDQEGRGSSQRRGQSRVKIEILDVNDYSPSLSIDRLPIKVSEDTKIGRYITSITVKDKDQGLNGEVNVTISHGNELGHFKQPTCFRLNRDYTCIVKSAKLLDKEKIAKYNLTFTASDKGTPPLTSSLSVIITLIDANDHAPEFQSTLYQATVSELNPVNSYVVALTATDEDEGENGRVTYQISSGNNDQFFKIDPDSGLVTVNRPVDSDSLSRSKVILNVSAQDHGTNPLTNETSLVITIIDENDEVPMFTRSEYRVTIAENSGVNITVLNMTATDRDRGANGSVRYRLSEETTMKYPGYFHIDPENGVITALKNLDRELTSFYEIYVVAYDLGTIISLSSKTKVELTVADINDNRPIFYPVRYHVEVPETARVGYKVVTVSATDLDIGDSGTVSYRLSSSTNVDKFSCSEATGDIIVRLALNAGETYSIEVEAVDGKGLAALTKAEVEIRVANPAEPDPVFEKPYGYTFAVSEDHEGRQPKIGQRVGTVVVNSTTTISYYITSGDPHQVFNIRSNRSSGIITTAKRLDREETSTYTLTVTAVGLTKVVSTKVTINIGDENDNQPVFDQLEYTVTINEDTPIDSVVFVAQATDLDAGINSRLNYSLVCSSNTDMFTINNSTAAIVLRRTISLDDRVSCEVIASDGGKPQYSNEAKVTFKAADVNDHSPVFEQPEYRVAVNESAMVNFRFLQVTATDEDLEDNGKVTYRLTSGVNSFKPEFGVFPDGSLYIAQLLDRETKDRYELIVEARDGGSPIRRSSTTLVHVKILDDNDNTPEFRSVTNEFKVLEGKDAGSYIGSVSASDKDVGRNADVMYFFTEKQYDFSIDPFTGEIRSKVMFDREEKSLYQLTVRAIDNGIQRRYSDTDVTVIVEDINDNSPTFTKSVFEIRISEDSQPGPLIYPITASDPDTGINGVVRYDIVSGNNPSKFGIDENTGQLSLKTTLNREEQEEYKLIIKAEDSGEQSKSSTATVIIKLEDANTQRPIFKALTYHQSISEDSSIGTVVTRVSATDKDQGANAVIYYSIIQGNDDEMFEIVKETGEIKLAKNLDYEYSQLYKLTVKAYNKPITLSSEARVNISVIDVNDNPPVFTSNIVSRFVPENSQNSMVVRVTATDKDKGDNGRLRYSIINQIPEDMFTIDQDGYIYTKEPLDRERVDEYKITVEATDQALPVSKRLTAQKVVSVYVTDVNDNRPKFISPPVGVVHENSARGTKVMTVRALDKDKENNQTIIYTLITETSLFHIDSQSGVISLANPISASEPMYEIKVMASDKGQPQKSSQQDIKILVASTVSSGLTFNKAIYRQSILENKTPGSLIIELSVNSDNVEFFVTNVTSAGVLQPGYFEMSRANEGQMITAMHLDRDQGYSNYIVEVYVRDKLASSPRTAKTDVEIILLDVNDSPPRFDKTGYEAEIEETATIGQLVTTVQATDLDADSVLNYTITNHSNKFSINKQGQVRVKGTLDRETKSQYLVVISAFDGTITTSTKLEIKILDVNDESPVFTEQFYTFAISELASPEDPINSVKAIDGDLGLGGQVQYRIIKSWFSDLFSINSDTGLINLNGTLDFEQVQLYVLTVEANDRNNTSHKSSATVYINVLDENDNTPMFTLKNSTPVVSEGASIGDSVVEITAVDLDSGVNSQLRYSLLTSDAPFIIDEYNGTIYTNGKLDREQIDQYTVKIQVSDSAVSQPRTNSTTVTIMVGDVNDNKPVFKEPYVLYINESTSVNSTGAQVQATDLDEGINSNMIYSLMTSTDTFYVQPNTGSVKVLKALDREKIPVYDLKFKVTDKGTPRLSSTAVYRVEIEDTNDNSPEFVADQITSITVREDQLPGVTLLNITATDADTGLASEIRYYIISGDPYEDFHLDQLTGKLSVSRGLDYERKKSYRLTVQAEDLGIIPRSSTITISVTVTDWNDCPPVFIHAPYYAYLQESTVKPVQLITVKAVDADSSKYNRITYQLYFGLDDDADFSRTVFSIDSDTGTITANKPVDREKISEFKFTVIAENYVSGGPALTGEATVNVIVNDINDHAPTFDLPVLSTSVFENQGEGNPVIRASASDLDAGINADIRYTLVNNTGAKSFKVDPVTGWITNKVALNREQMASYNLIVIAYDLGSISRSSSSNVQIYVKDVNDNTPSFLRNSYDVLLRDPTESGDFIVGTTAIDPDLGINGLVTYSLIGDDTSKFSIDNRTGIIKAAEKLTGMRSLNITVQAKDGANRRSTVPVHVTLRDIETSALPVFENTQTTITLNESLPVFSKVSQARASVSSNTASIIYTIAGGNRGNTFSIKPDGSVQLEKKLNFAVTQAFDLWIQAKDSVSGYTSHKNIKISIRDENDHAPQFDQALYITSVVEQQSIFGSKFLVKVTANDPDSGVYGQITYSLKSGNIDNPFILDSDDGSLKLIKQLDREAIRRYELVIEATDGGGLSSTTIVIVNVEDINDNFPRFESSYRWSIPEDIEVGSIISYVIAKDADVGRNANITYAFDSPNSKFAISSNGNISVKSSLDREKQSRYTLTVNAKNVGVANITLSGTTTVTILVTDVNDKAPQFLPSSNYTFSFTELQGPGTVVGKINSTDGDEDGPNSLVRYRLISPSSYFIIEPSTGILRSKEVLRYDGTGIHNSYNLYVEAQDSGIPSKSSIASVVVNIQDANDHSPQFTESQYIKAVPDSIESGSYIMSVTATDNQDYGVNAEVSYRVIRGNGTAFFGVRGNNGSVYVKNSLQGKVDKYLTVVIIAEDGGKPKMSSEVTVTLLVTSENRYDPAWVGNDPFIFDVSESLAVGNEIGTVKANDADNGINADIVYSIQSGNEFDLVSIDEKTGEITLMKPLDFEQSSLHQMTLVAQDRAFNPRLKYARLEIRVTDVDDNPPVFTKQFYVAKVDENLPANTSVITVTAKDIDEGRNAVIRYSIIGDTSSQSFFNINPLTGEITTRSTFDYENRSRYNLRVKASNPSSDKYETIVDVRVNVGSVNEFRPAFVQRSYTFSVSESEKVGYVIDRVKANDKDGGDGGICEYMLLSDSNGKGFGLRRYSGELYVAEELDSESVRVINLEALVKNPGPVTGNDTDIVSLNIYLADANDRPIFSRSSYNATVEENKDAGTSVFTAQALDIDQQASNREFTYAVDDSTNSFQINPQTGVITTTKSLDREQQNSYTVVMKAIDKGQPPLTGSATLYVQISDVNDQAPHFQPAIPEGRVTENSRPDMPVLNLREYTFDNDIAPNQGPFRYSLSSDYFYVDETTGVIFTKTSGYDYETTKDYKLTVTVADRKGKSAQREAKILVRDINDQPSSSRSVEINVFNYGSLVNGVIGTVEPLDIDTVGNYTCSILPHTSFSIINSGCFLKALDLSTDSRLQVNGSDGIHNSVESFVDIKVKPMSNQTLSATIVMRLQGLSVKDYVADRHVRFVGAVNSFSSQGSKLLVTSLQQSGDDVDLYLVLENTDNSYSEVTQVIQRNKNSIESQSGVKISLVKRDVCGGNRCSDNGVCKSQVVIDHGLDYTTSDSIILAYHKANLLPVCDCDRAYIGVDCSDPAGACISSPCLHGGVCRPIGESNYTCTCSEGWTGTRCVQDINECKAERPKCHNGGTCVNLQGGFQCNCTEHFRGRTCHEPIRCENRNPCQNGATCIDIDTGGYQCKCAYGFYGDLCQHSSFGFEEDSYLELSDVSMTSFDVVMTVATESRNSLLLLQPGLSDSQFMALQIIDGSLTFTFNSGQISKGLTSSRTVSSGQWSRIHAVRANNQASLEVVYCDSPIECNRPCNQDPECYSSVSLASSSSTRKAPLFVGGVPGIETLLPYSNTQLPYSDRLKSGSYLGCIGNIKLDGKVIDISKTNKNNIKDTCPRVSNSDNMCEKCEPTNQCSVGWFDVLCKCEGFASPNSCSEAIIDESVAFSKQSSIQYKYKESYRRTKLLNGAPSSRRRRAASPTFNQLTLSVRTGKDGELMKTEPFLAGTVLKISGSHVAYGDLVNSKVTVTDGTWHIVSLTVNNGLVALTVDGETESLNSSQTVDFLDLRSISALVIADSYEGCMNNLSINNKSLPMSDAVTDEFYVTVTGSDAVHRGCDGCPTSVNVCQPGYVCSDGSAGRVSCVVGKEDEKMAPWLLALIVVFSVVFVLCMSFAAVCIVRKCRIRKAKKATASTGMGTVPIISEIRESKRSMGHDNLPDRDILSGEKPSSRQLAVSPNLLQSSRTVPSPYEQLEDSTVIIEGSVAGTNTVNSDKLADQYYDFDEAASIAPSDVDIRKYYKGYRKGDNMEMQMIPRHMRGQSGKSHRTSPNHKVGQRESPHPRQYTSARQSPLIATNAYDPNRQETPISQLQQRGLRQTPIDELNRRIAMEQQVQRRDSESSLTDGSMIKQPQWSHNRNLNLQSPKIPGNSKPGSRVGSRPTSRQQTSRPASRQQTPLLNPISTQRQQDLNRLSHRSGSSSIDDSDDDLAGRQQMERNIYSEAGDSSSDESSNDSFTASEFEADEPKVRNDYQPTNMMFTKLQEVEDESDNGDPYAYRTTFSWDGLRNVDTSLQRFINNSDSNTDADSISKVKKQQAFRWDHFLSWGPSFEKLVGVFADIAELPQELDDIQSRASEEYV